MVFERELSISVLVIPPICAGLLLGGCILFFYLFAKYRSGLYMSITLLGLLGFFFVAAEAAILFIGSWALLPELSRHFHRIEQLAGLWFLAALPLFLAYFLTIGPTSKRILLILSGVMAAFSLVVSVIAFVVPDLFISMQVPNPNWLQVRTDHGRGKEGLLYSVRDILFAVLFLVSLIALLWDYFKNRRFKVASGILTGLLIAMYGAVADMLFVQSGILIDPFGPYSFSRFSAGITVFIAMIMSSMARDFVRTAREVERMHHTLTISEEKYRILVDSVRDCVFSLDRNFLFVSANEATLKRLEVPAESLGQHDIMALFDLQAEGGRDADLVRDQLRRLGPDCSEVSFRAFFKPTLESARQEYSISLARIEAGERTEIVGKAHPVVEDTLLPAFISEQQRYVMGNHLLLADEMSVRLSRNLQRYLPRDEVTFIRLGLREIIINAIEHGNLNLRFEEKTRTTEDGTYYEFIQARQQDPAYRDRTITIDYAISPQQARYRITDQGEGFDYHETLRKVQERVNREMLAHGRGLTIALGVFDEVRYNDKGNQVLLVKNLPENPAA